MIRPALALLALLSVPALAAERRVSVGSFDRVRVTGPFEVTHRLGSPGASVSGDARALERVEIRVDGTTLTIRAAGGAWGERPELGADGPVTIALSSPALAAASVFAGGRLSAARMRGPRVDLSVSGSGALSVADVQADQVAATLVGTGTVTLAGRAARARLVGNGSGKIDAGGLDAGELTVLLDGPGEALASARHVARVTNTGLGNVAVAGNATCVVTARAGGVVKCGR